MIIDEKAYLAHYGILRKSGRYPWGSGGNLTTRSRSFLDVISEMRKKGYSETEIAKYFSTPEHTLTTTELRAVKSIARNEVKQADIALAQRLKDKGYSNVAIGQRMGIPESTVRSYLAPGTKDKADVLTATTARLKAEVADKKYLDVGVGNEKHMNISDTKLRTAVAALQEEGYKLHYVKIPQLGTGKQTTLKVLTAPDVTYGQVYKNRFQITPVGSYSEDGGRSYVGIQPPLSINSRRVSVRYAEDGGGDADGVIYVRRGVDDISLGGASYAQVRIAVNGTHYLKGMAVYKDDMPDGVDLVFNTNKKNTGNKLDAMKPVSEDPKNPFSAVISRQITKETPDGRKVTSVMNVVNDDSTWTKWSRTLSSQVLSKQRPALAESQLSMYRQRKQSELDEIMALTNPTVRKKLLEEFADSADAASVHLKAHSLPRQSNHVILPVSSMKDNEVYAPTFSNGEHVVLIRHPHGGKFEIPQLVVNNKNPEARRLLGDAQHAIGINAKVAQRLSGADFDGDTVIVIPNARGQIKTEPSLAELKGFDPIAAYPKYPGMKPMSATSKQHQMGIVSNLITDMTIRGATNAELARAVRHSMVVIDAEKHELNYKQSEIDNGIKQLRQKYQSTPGKKTLGASTIVSRASSEERVLDRRPRRAAAGGPIDKATGQKKFEPTGATTINKKGVVVPKRIKSTQLAEVQDAHTLSSGTRIERIYADHSNELKAMANAARKAAVNIKTIPASPSAKTAYAKEVASLDAKLNVALRNAPVERRAQVVANAILSQKRQANPDMDASEIKKEKSRALEEARLRTGAKKTQIDITDSEWEAIQAGAISNEKLTRILNNADSTKVKQLATPKTPILMTSAKKQRALSMLALGYTQAEVAAQLGVSLTTLKNSIAT